MNRVQFFLVSLAALAMLPFAFTCTAHAATATWDGGVADDNNWMTATNWSGDTAPVPGTDNLVFAGTNDVSTNNDFPANSVFTGITFSAGADPFTLAGNGIVLGTPTPFGSTGSGNITNSSTQLQTVTLGVALANGNHTIAGGGSGLSFNIAGGTVKSQGTGGTVVFSGTVNSTTMSNFGTTGVLGGYASVGTAWATHNGAGIVAYAHSAGEQFAAGAAIADNADSNVKITTAGAANTLDGATTTNINTLIYDVNTAQTVNMTANQTLRLGQFGGIFKTGTTNAITFTIGNTAGTGSLTAGGSTDGTPGEIVVNGGAGTGTGTQMTINANVVDNGTDGTVTLIKTGRGYVQLAGTTNGYTGGTFINEGRLQGNASGAFGSGDVTVQSGGEAFLGGFTWNNNFRIAGNGPQNELGNGAIRGSGTIAGTVTLIGDAALAGGGSYTNRITGGFNLTLGSTGNLGGNGTNLSLTNTTANPNDWTGNMNIVARTGGTFNNTLVRLGASNQIPNGGSAGNLVFGVSGQTTSSAGLDLNGFSDTINGLSVGAGTPTLMYVTSAAAGGSLTVGDNNATSSFGGIFAGGSNLTLAKTGSGTLTLTETSYHGDTNVNQGTLVASGNAVVAAASLAGTTTSASNIVTGLASTAGLRVGQPVSGTGIFANTLIRSIDGANQITLTANATAGGTPTLSFAAGSALGNGNVVVNSGGTLLINGGYAGTGIMVASGGKLGGSGSIAGPVVVTGSLAPGNSAGTLTIGNNNLTLNAASTLAMDLVGNNTTEGGVNDLVAVTGASGNLTLDGTLNVTEIGGSNFANITTPGSTWTLITYGGALTDNGLDLGTMPALGSTDLGYLIDTSVTGKVLLMVVSTAVPESSAFLAIGSVAAGMGLVGLVRRRRTPFACEIRA